VFANALGSGTGAPRSGSGSGTTPTTASVGALTVNPGALIYNMSVASPPVGVDNDPAYTRVDFPSGDATLKDNAIYAVLANGGTGDPASTWYFDQRPTGGSWLATSLSLNAAGGSPPPPPPTGNLTVSTSTTGAGIPASYTATVDGGQSQSTPTTGSVTFTSLSAG